MLIDVPFHRNETYDANETTIRTIHSVQSMALINYLRSNMLFSSLFLNKNID